jgi:hypothetical protein
MFALAPVMSAPIPLPFELIAGFRVILGLALGGLLVGAVFFIVRDALSFGRAASRTPIRPLRSVTPPSTNPVSRPKDPPLAA